MENRTNDLSASDIIRDAFAEGVTRKGYAVVPVAESDRILRETLGISYGGQLPTTTPEEVCKALEVEAVFYGEVQEWSKTTTGIYNSATVAAVVQDVREGRGAPVGGERPAGPPGRRPRWGEPGGRDHRGRVGQPLLNPMTPHGKRVGGTSRKLPDGRAGSIRVPTANVRMRRSER